MTTYQRPLPLDQVFVGHHEDAVILEIWRGSSKDSVALTAAQATRIARRLLSMAEYVEGSDSDSAWVVGDTVPTWGSKNTSSIWTARQDQIIDENVRDFVKDFGRYPDRGELIDLFTERAREFSDDSLAVEMLVIVETLIAN